MRLTLGKTGLAELFEERIFSAEEVPRGKPHPDLFLHAARQLGSAPERCVVVEDSPSGVAAARAARMVVIGYAAFTPTEALRQADHVILDMDHLVAAIRALEAG
jgi:beta-phosphoglucomutase-like phosphatase (HAD superfamily)